MRLSLDRIRQATSCMDAIFQRTPQYECESLGKELGCRVTLKLETLNPIRSFKGRGAEVVMSRIAAMPEPQPVICASAGNLGQAIAYSGRSRGLVTTVVASKAANALKLDRIRELGASVRLVEGDIEDARVAAHEIAQHEGMFLVEDSENVDTCEGAGSIGLELLEVDIGIDVVFVALGGGAMATGIGVVCKQLSPGTAMVCVQPTDAPAMTLSFRAREVVETASCETIADGVAGRFPIPEVLDDLLLVADDALLVAEESIIRGMRLLYRHAGIVVEPSAALGIAAILENRDRFSGQHVATVICGSNVDEDRFRQWIKPI